MHPGRPVSGEIQAHPFKCRDLAVDRDLMEKRLAVHCEWLRQASLVTLALESFEKTLPNLERMGTFLEATQ
jgi:hypothetical protein